MTDVFISYSRKDTAFARRLTSALKAAGRSVWIDWEGIPLSAAWWEEIERGIEEADVFLFILSADSVASKVCSQEVQHAVRQNKRLIPVLWRDDFDVKDLHAALSQLNWVKCQDLDAEEQQGFQQLLATLDFDLEHTRRHTRLLTRALEWKQNKHDKSLLLRGQDLDKAETWLSEAQGKEPSPTTLQSSYIMQSTQAQGRRQRNTMIAIGFSFILTVALAIYAHMQRLEAETQTQTALLSQTEALSALSWISLLNNDQLFSLLAATQAAGEILQHQVVEPGSQLYDKTHDVLYDAILNNNEMNRLQPHGETIHKLAFSHDGELLLSVSSDKTVRIWTKRGLRLKDIPLSKEGRQVCFHPSLPLFAAADRGGEISLWRVKTKLPLSPENVQVEKLASWQHGNTVYSLHFDPSGQSLLSGGQDALIKRWDLEGRLLQSFKGHHGPVQAFSLNSARDLMASVGFDQHLILWRLSSGELLQRLPDAKHPQDGHQDRVYSIDLHPTLPLIVTAGADNTVRLWRQEQEGQPWSLFRTLSTHSNWVLAVRFSPDGDRFASASADKTIRLWSRKGVLLKTFLGHRSGIRDLEFHPSGEFIASAGVDAEIRLRRMGSSIIEILQGHRSSLKNVAFSSDDKMIASVGTDKTLKLWNTDGTLLKDVPHSGGLRSVDFHPNPALHLLAAAGYDHKIYLFDYGSGEVKVVQSWPAHQGTVKNIEFSSDGKVLVSASSDKLVKVWPLNAQGLLDKAKQVTTLNGHDAAVNYVAISPDDNILASGGADNSVYLWDRMQSKLLRKLEGHTDWVNNLSFSPDGKHLLSSSSDTTVGVWNVETGELERRLAGPEGHSGWVWQAKYSPDGKYIASASSDNTVKIWNESDKPLTTLTEHNDWVRALSFSHDGRRLASASADTSIILWDFQELLNLQSEQNDKELDTLVERACCLLQDFLSTNTELNEKQRNICVDLSARHLIYQHRSMQQSCDAFANQDKHHGT